jgi:threonine dehydratase
MIQPSSIDPKQIQEVEKRIRPFIRRTPVITIEGSDIGLGSKPLHLKLELFQHSGSFKTRGAFANMLLRSVPDSGVVAASGGNHGAAVAYAAMKLQKPARIFVPSIASPAKMDRIRSYGAHLVIAGERYADSLNESERWQSQSGALPIHAYNDVETILGQGTVGLEFEQQVPELDTVLIAVGGGGLIGGIASWYQNKVQIVGVEPEQAPTLTYAMQAGKPVDAPAGGIAADSLAPKQVGELMFPIAQKFVKQVVLVSDEAILEAQKILWEKMRIASEPGGAAALAALISGRYIPNHQERIGVLVCGGNTNAVNFSPK